MEVLQENSKHKNQMSLLCQAFQDNGYRTKFLKGCNLNFDDLSKYADKLSLPMLICGPVSGTDFYHIVGICPKRDGSETQLWLVDGSHPDRRPLPFCRETLDSCFGGRGKFTTATEAFFFCPGLKLSMNILANLENTQPRSWLDKSVCLNIDTKVKVPPDLHEHNIVRGKWEYYAALITTL
jgi:hypothetical protein